MEKIRSVKTGECPVCHRQFAILKDGRMGRHGSGNRNVWPPQFCPGWNQQAVPAGE